MCKCNSIFPLIKQKDNNDFNILHIKEIFLNKKLNEIEQIIQFKDRVGEIKISARKIKENNWRFFISGNDVINNKKLIKLSFKTFDTALLALEFGRKCAKDNMKIQSCLIKPTQAALKMNFVNILEKDIL